MPALPPFSAGPNDTVSIAVAAASANVLVTNQEGEQQIRVVNDGTATAWIAFGIDNTIAATLAKSVPIRSGATCIFTVGDGPVYAAAIAAGATGNVFFTPGAGS